MNDQPDTRPLYRPGMSWVADYGTAIPPLDRHLVVSYAELAESTMVGCAEWEENADAAVDAGLLLDVQRTGAYAAGVADALGWLAGGPLTRTLAELLELPTADTTGEEPS
jgi:hypothetical protein